MMDQGKLCKSVKFFRMTIVSGFTFLLLLIAAQTAFALPVIPGASGFGMDTPAGRGGTVYKVNSLANTNTPGTLKYALSQTGPRVIVFEVSGTIVVDGYLDINNPYVTIAGQTAPSPGIFLRGAVIRILTHDVLMQHIRSAPGDSVTGVLPQNRDAISINGLNGRVENVVIDHCTFTWSVDEMIETYNDYGNITFRNVIASEALHDSIHIDEGDTEPTPHGFGPLFDNQEDSDLLFYGSLVSHAEGRMPYSESDGYVQVNNVFYDRGNTFNRFNAHRGVPTQNAIVGNVFKNGPSLPAWAVGKKPLDIVSTFVTGGKFYLSDNTIVNHSFSISSQWGLIENNTSFTQSQLQVSTPGVWPTGLTAKPASEVLGYVADNAGARPADRLPYETRIINQAINGTGSIINSVAEAGGWPVVANNTRPLTVPSSTADDDGDGYTNLEEWLETMAAEVEGRVVNNPDSGPIANMTVNDTANGLDWSVQSNLQTGDLSYGDRTTVFSSIASSVAGQYWVRPAQDSKAYTGSTLFSFTVSSGSDVYVAHNDAITTKPSWLSTWTDTGAEIAGNGVTYSLYKKTYATGATVSLGNNGHTSFAQYIVIVDPISKISGLTVNDSANAADWSSQYNLQVGSTSYGDRTTTFSAIHSSVAGSEWIRPAMDSKVYTGTTLVSFQVTSNADVYVAHNDAITTKPTWLSTWTDMGTEIAGNGVTYSLYRKSFTSGSTVSLGNNGHTSYGQYIVVIK
jgi:hypothetical protein